MQVTFKLSPIAALLACGLLMTACGSLVGLDDDVPPPPIASREARQLRIPADLASNQPDRNPSPTAAAMVLTP